MTVHIPPFTPSVQAGARARYTDFQKDHNPCWDWERLSQGERDRECRAFAAGLEKMWQPISSAPKDGSDVLLWDADAFVGYYQPQGMLGQEGWYDHACSDRYPTHWQPLPAPPAAGDAA